jgi:hypothetical protein
MIAAAAVMEKISCVAFTVGFCVFCAITATSLDFIP